MAPYSYICTMAINPSFQRLYLLVGDQTLDALKATKVFVFGVGGVGSWCAESLVRSGVGHLVLVDSDTICITNVNRQLQATTRNVGKSKVEELRQRLLDINPKAQIDATLGIYEHANRAQYPLQTADFVIDAIDSLAHKVDLIHYATESGATLFSSMGAANKLDPSRIRAASIWKTHTCPLANLVRHKLRKSAFTGDFTAVFSDENMPLFKQTSVECGTHQCFCPDVPGSEAKDWCDSKKVINGTSAHITAIFGHWLAGMVLQSVHSRFANAVGDEGVLGHRS